MEKQQGKCTICESVISVDILQELGKCSSCGGAYLTKDAIQFLKDEPFRRQENGLGITGFALTLVNFVLMFSMTFSIILGKPAVIIFYALTLVSVIITLGISISALVIAGKKKQNKGVIIGSIVASSTQIVLMTILFAVNIIVWDSFLTNFI